MSIHMGTNDGTVPWCGGSGPATPLDKPTTKRWCPDCIAVFKRLYPGKALPPTLRPCQTIVPVCIDSPAPRT